MRLRRPILTAAVVAVCTTAAAAADLPTKAPPLLSPVNWTGLYAGGHLGYVQSRATMTDPTAPGVSNSDTLKGFLGGGQLGYNYQTGAWVLGIEADISGSNADANTTAVDPASGDVNRIANKLRWTSLVTGRVGYAFDRALAYIKGGVAFGGFRLDAADLTTGTSSSASYTRTGWTIGAGLDYALGGAWSIRGEYDYLGFGSKTLTLTDNTGATAPLAIKHAMHQFRVGLNYRFGGI